MRENYTRIDPEVLQAAKEFAHREGITAGQMLSTLARRSLTTSATPSAKGERSRSGVPVLPSRGEIITLEKVQQLMDKEGL